MEIVWSEFAEATFLDAIEQINERWDFEVATRFSEEVSELVDRIVHHNHICPKSKVIALHRCVINPEISLIYRITDNVLELVTFIFNRSNHAF